MPSEAPPLQPYVSEGSDLARLQRAGQERVVDGAIVMGILGMFPSFLTTVLVIAVLLQVKLLWDLARHWQFTFPRNPITLIGGYLNALGALGVALLAWAMVILLGAWVPLIDHYALSAALMSGSWTLGAAANQFFLNGFLGRLHRQEHRLRHD